MLAVSDGSTIRHSGHIRAASGRPAALDPGSQREHGAQIAARHASIPGGGSQTSALSISAGSPRSGQMRKSRSGTRCRISRRQAAGSSSARCRTGAPRQQPPTVSKPSPACREPRSGHARPDGAACRTSAPVQISQSTPFATSGAQPFSSCSCPSCLSWRRWSCRAAGSRQRSALERGALGQLGPGARPGEHPGGGGPGLCRAHLGLEGCAGRAQLDHHEGGRGHGLRALRRRRLGRAAGAAGGPRAICGRPTATGPAIAPS